ncbi:procathepsin L-like [Spea bombifrons]|uniref:procathepsin L-like n=1 Tax=Spea bombifrons TaxID=233779 RepID=UPI002349AE8E|nr:procathepsin L-like [Spea bombifrons]
MNLEKTLLVFSAISLVCTATHFLDEEWKIWKSKYGKTYSDEQEENIRRQIWEKIWDKVHNHNALAKKGLKNYTLAVNHFADMIPEELSFKRGVKCPKANTQKASPLKAPKNSCMKNSNVPEEVDWRNSGCVTPVKNEGTYCAPSWAFAVVGHLETRYCLKHNELLSFSEQQVVECDPGNDGCCGGNPEGAFQYVNEHGLMLSKDYEYTDTTFSCLYKNKDAVNLNITKYYRLTQNEDNISKAVAFDGPVAVSVHISKDFLLYDGGIFGNDDECSEEILQSMVIIGYKSHCDTHYWLLKNSWGSEWGEDGFARIDIKGSSCIKLIAAVAGDIGGPN